jgi:hypothetical protein
MKEAAKKAASVNDILEHGLVQKGNKYGINIKIPKWPSP